MDFAEALKKMFSGSKVKRNYWNDDVYIEIEYSEEFDRDLLIMQRREERFPLDISSDSIMAEDWELVR